MKISQQAIIIAIALLLSACVNTQVGQVGGKNIEFKSGNSEVVKQFKKRVNANGLLEVEIIFVSNYTRDLVYKVNWLDDDGFVLRDPINEEHHRLRIPINKEVVVRKVAINKLAKDVKIQIY
ncbi:MAG: DUF1425 domain-containing protein [Helicobacter sp.]|nr:DUF1425 domain-containing protein [Helicobacter sp.]